MSKKTRPRRPRKRRAPAENVQNTRRQETGLVVRGDVPADIKTPPPVVDAPTGMYVKLPLSPEIVEAGRELVRSFLAANTIVRDFLGTLEHAAAVVDRDVKKRRRRGR